MKKSSTTNVFNKGLIMDLNPLTTPNDVITDALNATLITYNGNEYALQNDMGNGRVETAYLPEGYIPLGTAELGGIIYIVSYNPQVDKCQIGCFPSPERNFTSDELGLPKVPLKDEDFVRKDGSGENPRDFTIISEIVKKRLTDFTVHPGDKFKVAGDSILNSASYLIPVNIAPDSYQGNVRLRLGTLDSSGQVIELDDSDLLKYTYSNKDFIIQDGELSSESGTDIDEYRRLVDADYNIYQSKVSGELYLIAKLAVINSFDVTYSVTSIQDVVNEEDSKVTGQKYGFTFYFNTTNDYQEFGDVKLFGINTKIDPPEPNSPQDLFVSVEQSDQDSPKLTIAKDSNGVYNYSVTLNYNNTNNEDNIVTYTFTPVLSVGKYPLFTTSISINLDLLGTGVIQSTIWKYYKNLNSMNLYFNLDIYPLDTETYENLTIYFFKYSDLPSISDGTYEESIDLKYKYSIPKRKSYSGVYTEEISFEDIEENSLYLVVFEFKISELTETGMKYKYKHLYRCLYTNGVFNQKYIDNNVLDFDTTQLDFDWTIDYTNSLKQITLTSDTSRKPPITSNTLLPYIRGEQKYIGEWSVELNPKLSITEDYNTFTVDQQFITITSSILDTTHVREGELINSSDTNIDSHFVQLVYSDENDPSHEFQTTSNSSVETSVNKENVYTIDGTFYIPISATSTLKSCTAQELFKPAISTLDELESIYGFTIANNHFSRSNNYVGIGMSNGGTDNTGGGGLFTVYGTGTYQSNFSFPAVASPGFSTSGNQVGEWHFPDIGFSNLINNTFPFPIVPVHLRWTGYGRLQLIGGDERLFANDENGGHHEEKRIGWFETGDKYNNSVVLWTFMKDNNESQVKYYALNLFFKTSDSSTALRYVPNQTAIDVLVSMLMSVFVKVTGSDQQFKVYTVNEFSYYESVVENITSNLKFTLEVSTEGFDNEKGYKYILFNDKPLYNIYDDFKAFGKFECLKFKEYDVKVPISININNKITLTNDLVSKYLQCYQDNPILDQYFINIFDNINSIELKYPLSTSYNIYFIDSSDSSISEGKIVLSHYSGDGKVCFIKHKEDSYNTFRFNIEDVNYYDENSQDNPSQLINFLTYSSRYNQILLDKSKMSVAPSTFVYFLCNNWNESKDATVFNHISIGNNFTVTNGL